MYWVALVALVIAAGFDLQTRRIPDTISVALLIVALGAKLMGYHPVSWAGIGLGVGLAFAVSAGLFALGALGGGDAKLFTALGAALGAAALFPFVVATSVIGGLVALFLRRKPGTEMAYAPVMLAGLLVLLPLVWASR